MNYRIVLSLMSLCGMLLGLLVMLSPIFVTGGYIGWEKGVKPETVEHLLSIIASIVFGIVIMIGSGVSAVVLGVVFGIEAASRKDTPPKQDPSEDSQS